MLRNKIFSAVLSIMTAAFCLAPATAAAGASPVLLDGKDISQEIGLSLQGGQSWSKLRPLVEQLGWDAVWNGQTGTIQLVPNPEKVLTSVVGADNLDPLHAVALKAAEIAMAEPGLGGRADLLVLTNAGYAEVNQSDSSSCLDALAAATGCTPGKGSLLQVHSACTASLYFYFFDSRTGNAAYLAVNPASLEGQQGPAGFKNVMGRDRNALFTRVSTAKTDAGSILADPAAWNKKVADKVFDGREFSLVTIANLAASGKAPSELISSALFHDHLCPGVTAGYLIAKAVMEALPLQAGQSYYIIASPPWCKDDALQVMLNTTVGKQTMAVLPLSAADTASLSPEAQNATGIYFRYDSSAKTGQGIVLGFDWDKLYEDCGIGANDGFPWESRFRQDLWMSEHIQDCMKYVQTIKSFDLEPGTAPSDYARPGVNPWSMLGLWKTGQG